MWTPWPCSVAAEASAGRKARSHRQASRRPRTRALLTDRLDIWLTTNSSKPSRRSVVALLGLYLRSRFVFPAPLFPMGEVAALTRSFIGVSLGFPFESRLRGSLSAIRFLLRKQSNNNYVGNDKRGY